MASCMVCLSLDGECHNGVATYVRRLGQQNLLRSIARAHRTTCNGNGQSWDHLLVKSHTTLASSQKLLDDRFSTPFVILGNTPALLPLPAFFASTSPLQ